MRFKPGDKIIWKGETFMVAWIQACWLDEKCTIPGKKYVCIRKDGSMKMLLDNEIE